MGPFSNGAGAEHLCKSNHPRHGLRKTDSDPQRRGNMIASESTLIDTENSATSPLPLAHIVPKIGLEQYYREAGPDYAAWSREFNMHFGYYRARINPLRRESMLEQMNAEVLARLKVDAIPEPQLLDLGC